MSATPYLPWVICEQAGEIVNAHCTCVWLGKLVYGYIINKRQFAIKVCTYRLGDLEACSHVAAVISCLIEAAQHQEQTTACTSKKCSWLPTVRNVSYESCL